MSIQFIVLFKMNKLFKILFSSLTIYAFILFFGAWLTLKYQTDSKDANIKTYYDALWWSLNATSIGDSNVYPITVKGRIVGVFLILIGYGLFTINVATINSALNNIIKNNSITEIAKQQAKQIRGFLNKKGKKDE